jgi:hypothetical protein
LGSVAGSRYQNAVIRRHASDGTIAAFLVRDTGRDTGRIMASTGLRTLGVAAALMMASWAGAAHVATLAALRPLQTGQWELRERGEGAETRKLCVTDLRQLLQVRHGRALCRSFIINDAATMATVTYDCAAGGNGRTDLRVETPKLVQINSQGIADGAPFAFTMEARHIGACQQ